MSDYYLRVWNQLEFFQGFCSSWTGLFKFLGMPGSWLRRQPGSLFHVFLISLWTSRLAQACPSHAGGWSTAYRPPKCKPISCFCFCHSHWHPTDQSKVCKWAQSQEVGQVPHSLSLVGRSCQATWPRAWYRKKKWRIGAIAAIYQGLYAIILCHFWKMI